MSVFNSIYRSLTPSTNFYTFYQNVRHLPRWQHRRPVRVIEAENYDENRDAPKRKQAVNEEVLSDITPKIKWKPPHISELSKSEKALNYKLKPKGHVKPLTILKQKPKVSEIADMLEVTIDSEGQFIYTKMKNNDSRVSSIMVMAKSKSEKEKKDLILLEGKRLIEEALQANCKLEYILFSRMKELEYLRPLLPKMGAKLYKVPYREMQLWSDLTTNPGIMGIFKIPDVETYVPSANALPITVVCDNIREAGNLGALLRICSGAGCSEVILTKGCVNLWDTKVLRSACGAHFKLKIRKRQDWQDIKNNLNPNSNLFIADSSTIPNNSLELNSGPPVIPYYGVNFDQSRQIVLIVGGETEGISENAFKLAEEFNGVRLNIPLDNNVDSLNAGTALGIIAFEIKRQLIKK